MIKNFFSSLDKVFLSYHNISTYLKWYFFHSDRLLYFNNIHKGEDCFIIGNGPSINKMDLAPLKDYHTFGLNKIYLIFDKVDLNLSYHVAVNPLVIQQSKNQIESLSCPSFLSFRAARKIVRHLGHIYFLITGGPFTFRRDLIREIHTGATVTYVAMQIAFYMGFSKVFLIGIDHNFTISGTPNEKQFLKGDDFNHFDSRYFKNSEWQLPDLEASELSYHMAKFHFVRAGRQIYDVTLDGKLNIFPKISFEEALDTCKKVNITLNK